MGSNKEKIFFANLHGIIKLQVFPKLMLYVESPKVMVNKCVITNCSAGYKTSQNENGFILWIVEIGYLPVMSEAATAGVL